MEEFTDQSECGGITKQNIVDMLLYMKYEFPKVCAERQRIERELIKENPFWPFRMPSPEDMELIKKWSEKED